MNKTWPVFLIFTACAFLAASAIAEKKKTAPRRTPVITEEMFAGVADRTILVPDAPGSPSWHHRVYIESYQHHGNRDPKWNDLVERALELDIGELSGLADASQESIRDAYAAAVIAGCDDPLVQYRYARAKDRSEDLDYMDRRILFTEAAMAMAKSPYPAFIKCWSFVRAARYQPAPNNAQSRTQGPNMTILLDAVLDLVPVLLKDDDMKPLEIGVLVEYYARAYKARYGDKEKGYDQIYNLFYELAPEKKLLLLTLRANYYRKAAWEARGNSYAYAISEDNWNLYSEHLDEALSILLEMWNLNPEDAEVAAQIEQIYAQRCDPRAEKWFQKALEIDPANRRARSIKLHFLQPKWCGSIERLVDFGKECFATDHWDTRVPHLLVDAHVKAANSFSQAERRAYLAQTNVWSDIKAVYEKCLNRKPDAHWDRSRFAFYATECSQWKKADALLRELGTNVNPRAFGGAVSYSNTLLAIANKLHGEEIPDTLASPQLMAAVVNGDIEALTALLDEGARLDAKDKKGRSILWRAIKSGQTESVRILVERGADVKEKPFGKYPILFTAISADNIEMTAILLDHGAGLHAWDTKKQYNALTTAIRNRNPEMVEFLLERGARIKSRDKKKNCALIKAASLGFPEMVEMMVEHGADLESRNSWQYTALMTAAVGGKKSVVKELLRLGAEVDAKTTLDTTALANASYRGHTEMMEILLDAGADINIVNKQEDMTPLMQCAESGHYDAAKLLLERGADTTMKNRIGKTAAEIASARGHTNIAELINSEKP